MKWYMFVSNILFAACYVFLLCIIVHIATDIDAWIPFIWACYEGCPKTVETLIQGVTGLGIEAHGDFSILT